MLLTNYLFFLNFTCELHMQHKLRIGSGAKTLLAALGHAALYTEEKPLPPANMSSRLEEVNPATWKLRDILLLCLHFPMVGIMVFFLYLAFVVSSLLFQE